RISKPGIIETARRIVQSDLIAPGGAITSPMKHRRRVIKDSISAPNGRSAVAAYIPGQTQPRSEFQQTVVVHFETGNQRIAGVLKAGRSVFEYVACDALVKPRLFKVHGPA